MFQRLAHLTRILFVIAFFAVNIFAAAQEGNVTFRIVTQEGDEIPCVLGEVYGRNGLVKLSSNFDGLKGTHIPYGKYIFNFVRKPTGPFDVLNKSIERAIEIDKPEALFVIIAPKAGSQSTAVGDRYGPKTYVVPGKVERLQAIDQGLVWLRFVPILRDGAPVDVEVDSTGEFRVYGYLAGRYLLMVVRNGRIMHLQEVYLDSSLPNSDPLIITLPERR
jgi:hypothetical protein